MRQSPATLAPAPVPKYYRVKASLAARMADGTWPPGSLLPTEPELCLEFAVSRITVRKAISDLAHEGMIITVQGKGTFVAKPKVGERFIQRNFGFFEDMRRRGFAVTTEVLRQEVQPAGNKVAERLALRPGDCVHVIVRRRAVDGERFSLSTTYIPEALCPGLANEDLSQGSLFQLLATHYNVHLGHGERTLEAVAAGQAEARMLDLALASPLLRLDSTGYMPDGRPFEFSNTFQRGDRALVELKFFPAPDDSERHAP